MFFVLNLMLFLVLSIPTSPLAEVWQWYDLPIFYPVCNKHCRKPKQNFISHIYTQQKPHFSATSSVDFMNTENNNGFVKQLVPAKLSVKKCIDLEKDFVSSSFGRLKKYSFHAYIGKTASLNVITGTHYQGDSWYCRIYGRRKCSEVITQHCGFCQVLVARFGAWWMATSNPNHLLLW